MHTFSLSAGAIVVRGSQVLLVKHNYGPTKGRWDFIRGYVEPQETIDHAVEREVYEETGIRSSAGRIIAVRQQVRSGRNDVLLIWAMHYLSGEPRPDGREISDARFFGQEEMEACPEISGWAKEVIKVAQTPDGLTPHSYVPKDAGGTAWKFFSI